MAYASDRTPLELTALTSLASDDTFVVGDTSDVSEVAKSITKANLVADILNGYQLQPSEGAFVDGDKTKLDGIEVSADVTDETNVVASLNGATLTGVTVAGTDKVIIQDVSDTDNIKTVTAQAIADLAAGGVSSVNSLTGAVVLDPDDLDDTATTNKFVTAADITTLSNTSGTNTGDQTSIVGITGTKAQFDTAVTDGDFMYIGDAPTAHTHLLAAGATDVTATAAELNIMDGVTATTAEINYVDGVTSNVQTQLDSKLNSSLTIEPGTDDTYEGISSNDINAGATIAQWELVYLDATPDWNLTDASAEATAGPVQVALATEAGTATNPLNVLFSGVARNDAWTWTAGGAIYMSETAGAMTQTAPTTTDSVTRVLGYALSDDAIYFNPSNDWVVHV